MSTCRSCAEYLDPTFYAENDAYCVACSMELTTTNVLPFCEGCRYNQMSQKHHLGPGGCLEPVEDDYATTIPDSKRHPEPVEQQPVRRDIPVEFQFYETPRSASSFDRSDSFVFLPRMGVSTESGTIRWND